MKIRVGFGFDVHQLVEGRELWLGGIRLEHSKGLLGHSDADVLLHTVCDALLGAANMRDTVIIFRILPESTRISTASSFEKDGGTDCDQRIPCREYRCDYLRGASQTESPYPFDAGNDGSRHGNRCGRYLDQGNYDGETRFYRTGRRHFRLCYCVDREGLTKQITNPLKQ